MSKFHINPETGRPNQCTAKIKCRFGADTKHYASKDEARVGYEKDMKEQTLSKSLKKSEQHSKNMKRQAAYNAMADKEAEKLSNKTIATEKLPFIPGRPPVGSKYELDDELSYLENEELRQSTVKNLLKDRDVDIREIREAEKSGEYAISVKIPSSHEVYISTDLARRELGLPAREKTGIDESPVRKAKFAMDEASSKTSGSFKEGEYEVAQRKYKDAEYDYQKLIIEEELERANKARLNGDSSRGALTAVDWKRRVEQKLIELEKERKSFLERENRKAKDKLYGSRRGW